MCQMTGKVVCTKLIFRVPAHAYQIIGPAGEDFLMLFRIFQRIFCLAQGCHTEDHISALFHRHLIIVLHHPCLPVITINLSVCQRILPYIMRCIGEFPVISCCIMEDGIDHPLHQLRLIFQIKRNGRIGHIHRTDAAVAVTFLGEKSDLAVHLNKLMGGNGLPVGNTENVIVLFSVNERFLFQFFVKSLRSG